MKVFLAILGGKVGKVARFLGGFRGSGGSGMYGGSVVVVLMAGAAEVGTSGLSGGLKLTGLEVVAIKVQTPLMSLFGGRHSGSASMSEKKKSLVDNFQRRKSFAFASYHIHRLWLSQK